jgi:hypothetical protein
VYVADAKTFFKVCGADEIDAKSGKVPVLKFSQPIGIQVINSNLLELIDVPE